MRGKEYIQILKFNIRNVLSFKPIVILMILILSMNLFKKYLYSGEELNYVAGVAGLIKDDLIYKIMSYYMVIILLMYNNNFNKYFIDNISQFMIRIKSFLVIRLSFISNICINVFIITILNMMFSILVFGTEGNYFIKNSTYIKNDFILFINFTFLTFLTFLNISLFNNYLILKYKNVKNAILITFFVFVGTLEFSLIDSSVLNILAFLGTGNFINFLSFSFVEVVSLYIYIVVIFIILFYMNFKTINRQVVEEFIINKETIYD